MSNDAPLLIDVTRMIWRRWTQHRPTGIDRVCLAYLQHFAPRAQAVIQSPRFRRILDRRASQELFDVLLNEDKEFGQCFVRLAAKGAWAAMRSLPGGGRLYLNVGHTGLDKPGFGDWIKHAYVRPVYMVHDLIPITHPEYCRDGEAAKHRLRIRTMLETGSAIIGNSQATLDVLNSFACSESLPALPQIPCWLGSIPLISMPDALPRSERPYFVILGTIEGRKNHLLLLNIWAELVRELGQFAPQLRIIGQRGWEADQVFATLDRAPMLKGHVVEINDCTDTELADHLFHARALLFPSMAEGYGLPLVEALGAGIPVIASNISVFREIAGDVPDYLSPLDGIGWKQVIYDYMAMESPKHSTQLERLADYHMPDWQTHFRTIDHWLDNLLEPQPAGALHPVGS
jgi:glycosyltransferase involved in cell wall biosynthesis